jgi:hypothetical protein
MLTNRDSMRRRRAASSISSGRTPVGYRNFFSTKQKPPQRRSLQIGEEVESVDGLSGGAPFRFGARWEIRPYITW